MTLISTLCHQLQLFSSYRMLALLATILLAAVHCGLAAENRTSRLYNPIVQLVNFPNHPCSGSSTRLQGKIYGGLKNIYVCVCQLDGDLLQPGGVRGGGGQLGRRQVRSGLRGLLHSQVCRYCVDSIHILDSV